MAVYGGVGGIGKETELKIQFQTFSNLKFTFSIIEPEIGKKQASRKLPLSHYNEFIFSILQRWCI